MKGIKMEKFYQVLEKSSLFNNIDKSDLAHLLLCLSTELKSYHSEKYLFFAGDQLSRVGIIVEGVVEVMKENLAGDKHIIAFLEEADMFAEGIVCTRTRISPVTARVKTSATILWIPYEKIIKSCGNTCDFHVRLIQNMMTILGEKNVILNKKLELLSLKGMREKIASFLLNESVERNLDTFSIVQNRMELADYLNVSRTSMCRELTRMKEDGLIDYYGKSFKILDKKSLAKCLE